MFFKQNVCDIQNQNTKQNYAFAVCKQKHASNAEGKGQIHA